MKYCYLFVLLCAFLLSFGQKNIRPKGLDLAHIGMSNRLYFKQELIFDLDTLKKMLEHIHPNIYHTRPKSEIEQIYKDIKSKLPSSLNRNQYYYIISSFISEYEDGHIGAFSLKHKANSWNVNFLAAAKQLPFEVYKLGEELFVTDVSESKSEIKTGDILLKINGHKADSLFEIMQKSQSGNKRFQAYYAGKNFPYLLELLEIRAPFTVQFRSAQDGTIKEITQKKITNAMIESHKPTEEEKSYIDTCTYFSFGVVDNNIAYIKFKRFSGVNVLHGTLRDHLVKDFQYIQKKNISKLIIDLRDNTGGYIRNIDYIISYLTEIDYPLIKKIGTKASHALGQTYCGMKGTDKTHLQMKFINKCSKEKILIPLDSIYYETCLSDTIEHKSNRYLFKGKTCFLVGPGTFSAANLTAAIIKDNKIATLIGEATDEPVNDYGNVRHFVLPKSGIPVGIPTASLYCPSRSETDKSNVKPDIEVMPDRNALIKGEDVVLKKAMEWMRND